MKQIAITVGTKMYGRATSGKVSLTFCNWINSTVKQLTMSVWLPYHCLKFYG